MRSLPLDCRRFQQDRKERAVRFDHLTLYQMRYERRVVAERLAEQAGRVKVEPAIADESVRFLAVQLQDFDAAIARRERVLACPAQDHQRYSQLLAFARDLKRAVPLEEFVERMLLITLRRMGRELAGTCPLGHDSVSGLCFRVNPDKQVFKCWHCGAGGDLFVLVGLLRGEERFSRQVEIAAEAVGITRSVA